MRIKTIHYLKGALFGFLALANTAPAFAEDIRIGAMREGSAWYVFAATLEQMLEPALGANTVEVIARGGGVANPMVVQTGKAEIALSNVATAIWAREGRALYGGQKSDRRACSGGWPK